MAKTPTRRAYEYDHHYGLALGGKTGSKAGRGRASSAATSEDLPVHDRLVLCIRIPCVGEPPPVTAAYSFARSYARVARRHRHTRRQ